MGSLTFHKHGLQTNIATSSSVGQPMSRGSRLNSSVVEASRSFYRVVAQLSFALSSTPSPSPTSSPPPSPDDTSILVILMKWTQDRPNEENERWEMKGGREGGEGGFKDGGEEWTSVRK